MIVAFYLLLSIAADRNGMGWHIFLMPSLITINYLLLRSVYSSEFMTNVAM